MTDLFRCVASGSSDIPPHQKIQKILNEIKNNQLKSLLTQNFKLETAMRLIRMGADPNTKNEQGQTLLHFLVKLYAMPDNSSSTDFDLRVYITDCIYQGADINQADANGFTPLAYMLNANSCMLKKVMFLLKMGANPETESNGGETLLDILNFHKKKNEDQTPSSRNEMIKQKLVLKRINDSITEVEDLIKDQKTRLQNNYLNFLIFLSVHFARKQPSFFSNLPHKIIIKIIESFGPNYFKKMGKSAFDCLLLANTIFSEKDKIIAMLQKPAGISVLQKKSSLTGQTYFCLFKSLKILSYDYELLKNYYETTEEKDEAIEAALIKYRKNYLPNFQFHVFSIFEKEQSKIKIQKKIRGTLLDRDSKQDARNLKKILY